MPVPARRRPWAIEPSVNVPLPSASIVTTYPIAGISRMSVSMDRLSADPVLANFLIMPYVANAPAMIREVQGTRPRPVVSTITATKPRATATHCVTRSRSRKTATPRATLTSGLMK